jgi:hypothetical protein
MSTGKLAFKESDVKRAIRAVQAVGLEVLGVSITKDGAIDLRTGKEEKSDDEFSNDEILRRLRNGNHKA